MWPVVQFYSSNIFRPAQLQLQSGYQVLPPRRRWDFRESKLRALPRKDRNLSVVREVQWRCHAQEFLRGLWHDFEMVVGSGRSTLGSENRKELKRLPSIVATKLDCFLMFVYSPFCLRLSLFLSMFLLVQR